MKITKYECVGHVQKRVGKHLREAKRKVAALNRVARKKLKELKEKEKERKEKEKERKEKERKAKRREAKGKRKGKGKGKAMEEADEAVVEGERREVVEREKEKEEEFKVIKGVFSDKTIDLLQTYYGNAIRSHVEDLEGMKRACWAVFYHSVSTDGNPQHFCCPEGTESWCKYQCALALHQDVPPHTLKIPADFEPFVKPVFQHLCQ